MTTMEVRRAELFDDMIAHAAQILRELGVDQTAAEHAGTALADHLAEHWGGQVISIPVDFALRLSQREREILADHKAGMTRAELARKWKLTENGVGKLLRRAQRRNAIDSQLDLFDGQG